jgi:hypothetical protein
MQRCLIATPRREMKTEVNYKGNPAIICFLSIVLIIDYLQCNTVEGVSASIATGINHNFLQISLAVLSPCWLSGLIFSECADLRQSNKPLLVPTSAFSKPQLASFAFATAEANFQVSCLPAMAQMFLSITMRSSSCYPHHTV